MSNEFEAEHEKKRNKKLKIAICDDMMEFALRIERLASLWAGERNQAISTFVFDSAEAFLLSYSEEKDYDILLLDIEMGGMDGVTLAMKIREGNSYMQIVFITGHSDYISEGYDVSALHYLMKPLNEDKLYQVLDRAAELLHKGESTITLSMQNETVKLRLSEIRYLEVVKNYVTVHAGDDYVLKKTLSEFEELLSESFYRIGRSFIVNLRYIKKVTKTDVYLLDGSVIPLPRGQYDSLNRAIIGDIRKG